MTKNAHYVQVVHDQCRYDSGSWTPWYNDGDSAEQTAMLAAHKFAREAGYGSPATDELKPLALTVFVATKKDARGPNGEILTCTGFSITITKTE